VIIIEKINTINIIEMQNSISLSYRKIKSIFLNDKFDRAINDCTYISKVYENIYISDLESSISSDFKNVLSLVKFNHTNENTCIVLFDDVNYSNTFIDIPNDLEEEFLKLKDVLIQSYNFLHEHRNEKTLIHCKKGMSRSSFIFLYYLLQNYYNDNYSNKVPILYDLVLLLKKMRPCIMIGDLFIYYLCLVEWFHITS